MWSDRAYIKHHCTSSLRHFILHNQREPRPQQDIQSYGSEEEESQRKMIWLANRKLVLEHNMLADQGLKTYRLRMNHFADMDDQEYQATFSCMRSFNRTNSHTAALFHRQAGAAQLPESVNWTAEGYVTKVKYQSMCGSCWAFSATGAVEAQMFKKTGKLVSLSEQQLVDCSSFYGNNGCEGGDMAMALEYVKDNGLQSEESYPYKAVEEKCRFDPQKVDATCKKVVMVLPKKNERALQKAVATIGPISVGLDVSRFTFRLYDSGVYEDPFCSSSLKKLNHAVLVTGYGINMNGHEFWLVKNSWGDNWGDNGYIKIYRNKNNMCGIASYAVYPVI